MSNNPVESPEEIAHQLAWDTAMRCHSEWLDAIERRNVQDCRDRLSDLLWAYNDAWRKRADMTILEIIGEGVEEAVVRCDNQSEVRFLLQAFDNAVEAAQ